MPETKPEVLFYHLEHRRLEDVLPALLLRTLARQWRAVVQVGNAERLEALDTHLWTFTDDSFLAHGTAKDGFPAEQPVWLTTGDDNPNGAAVRFLVDGADCERFEGYQRFVYLFDGDDPAALQLARDGWKRAKAGDCAVTYWQQSEDGQWQKKA